MTTRDESIEVNSSLRATYSQWTQLETFRYFLDGVRTVTRTGPTTARWELTGGREPATFDVTLTEDEAAHRVTWAAAAGPRYAGAATVYRIDDSTTRVRLQTDIDGRDGAVAPKPGDGRQPEGDLDRFKRYIEASGDETGAWQGFVGGTPPK